MATLSTTLGAVSRGDLALFALLLIVCVAMGIAEQRKAPRPTADDRWETLQ